MDEDSEWNGRVVQYEFTTREHIATSAQEADGGSLEVRLQHEPGSGDQPGQFDKTRSHRLPLQFGREMVFASMCALPLACAVQSALASPVTLLPVEGYATASASGGPPIPNDGYPAFLNTLPPDSDPLPFSIFLLSGVPTASAAVTVAGGVDPAISASVSVAPPGCWETSGGSTGCTDTSAGAEGLLFYQLAIEGPTTTSQIPVLLQGSNTLIVGNVQKLDGYVVGSATATATVSVSSASGTQVANEPGSGTYSDTLNLSLGTIYNVLLEGKVSAMNTCLPDEPPGSGYCGTVEGASVSIDPTFTIDPNFLNANQYSIEFSPGLLNGGPSSVPEPGTGVLLFGGLPLLMFMRRKRHL